MKFLLLIFLLSVPNFAAGNEHMLYKIIELKKNEFNDAITSIPIIGDILTKDEIKGEFVYIRNNANKIFVTLKKKELSFKNTKIFSFKYNLNTYKFDLNSNVVIQTDENQEVLKKFSLDKIIDTNTYSNKINFLNEEKINLNEKLDKSKLFINEKNQLIDKLKFDIKELESSNAQLRADNKEKINNKSQLINKLEIDIKKLESSNAQLRADNKEKINNKNQLIDKLKFDIKELESSNAQLRADNKEKINNKNQLIDKLETELKNLISTEELKEVKNKSEIKSMTTFVKKIENDLKNQISINKKQQMENNSKIKSKDEVIKNLKIELQNLKSINKKLEEDNKPFYKKLIN